MAVRHDAITINPVAETGTRIGEVLALRWTDIDLAAKPRTATIAGTIVRVPSGPRSRRVRLDHPQDAP
jgi:integrase